jgi:hypothetical protein
MPFQIELIFICVCIHIPSQTEHKVIGHHNAYVQSKLKVIEHFVRRFSDRYFKACCGVSFNWFLKIQTLPQTTPNVSETVRMETSLSIDKNKL